MESLVEHPLVSCAMITYDRADFARQAVAHFENQHYDNRELVIIDDGPEPLGDWYQGRSDIRYVRLDRRLPLGAKRNLACEHSRGDLIAHWDDDDWYAPWRLNNQVRALQSGEAILCGLGKIIFYDPVADQAWLYRYGRAGGCTWLGGGTFCYRRDFWEEHPFDETHQAGEDNAFLARLEGRRVSALDDESIYVALMHGGNLRQRQPHGPAWSSYPVERVRERLGMEAVERARRNCSELTRRRQEYAEDPRLEGNEG